MRLETICSTSFDRTQVSDMGDGSIVFGVISSSLLEYRCDPRMQWTIGMVNSLCSLTVYTGLSRLVRVHLLAPLGACLGFGLDLLPSLVSASPAVCAPLLRL